MMNVPQVARKKCFRLLASMTAILISLRSAESAVPSLRMPFSSGNGQLWTIHTGYGGSGTHQNDDYYALDFNITGTTDHGEPILAVAAGTVTRAGWSAPLPGQELSYGYRVYVDHGGGCVSCWILDWRHVFLAAVMVSHVIPFLPSHIL